MFRGAQHFHARLVKIGDGSWRLSSGMVRVVPFAGFEHQLVRQKIEAQLKGSGRHTESAKWVSPRECDVQGHVPPVVHQRRQLQAHFADDLRPHVQGRTGVFELVERQRRPASGIIRQCNLPHDVFPSLEIFYLMDATIGNQIRECGR